MASAKPTTDHEQIRRWVEERGGHPAHVRATSGRNDPGVLRIDYPGYTGKETLERISWDEWFKWFDHNSLAFLFQEGRSRFSKLVDRASVKLRGAKSSSKRSTGAKKASASSKKSSKKSAAAKSRAVSSGSKKAAKKTSSKKTTSSKKASSKKASSKKASSRKAPAKKASSSKNRTTTSTRSASARRGSAKKSSAAKKSGGKTAAKKASGRKSTARATSRTSSSAVTTTNHDEIRQWVEARGGFPAHVKRTASGKDPGVLRIDYPGYSGKQSLERMSWDEWFDAFEENDLAFLYQNKANSRFSKLVSR